MKDNQDLYEGLKIGVDLYHGRAIVHLDEIVKELGSTQTIVDHVLDQRRLNDLGVLIIASSENLGEGR